MKYISDHILCKPLLSPVSISRTTLQFWDRYSSVLVRGWDLMTWLVPWCWLDSSSLDLRYCRVTATNNETIVSLLKHSRIEDKDQTKISPSLFEFRSHLRNAIHDPLLFSSGWLVSNFDPEMEKGNMRVFWVISRKDLAGNDIWL